MLGYQDYLHIVEETMNDKIPSTERRVIRKNSLYVCLFVSGSGSGLEVTGQKNIFMKKAQNFMKYRLGGVLRFEIGWRRDEGVGT